MSLANSFLDLLGGATGVGVGVGGLVGGGGAGSLNLCCAGGAGFGLGAGGGVGGVCWVNSLLSRSAIFFKRSSFDLLFISRFWSVANNRASVASFF